MEPLDYNLLFRWFVGLNRDDPIWDFTVFSKNRERLLEADVARAFFEEVGELARAQGLLSDEHFEETQAGRRNLRLVQDRRPDAEDEVSRLGARGMDVHLDGGSLQSGAKEKPVGSDDVKSGAKHRQGAAPSPKGPQEIKQQPARSHKIAAPVIDFF